MPAISDIKGRRHKEKWRLRVDFAAHLVDDVQKINTRVFSTSKWRSGETDKASQQTDEKTTSTAHGAKKRKKTMEQMDEEIRAAMEGRSGDGGISGAELEGGKAVAMKRGVRDNMFRYI